MYVDAHENLGLRFYLHKYFLGFHPYYMQVKNQEFFESSKQDENTLGTIPIQETLKS